MSTPEPRATAAAAEVTAAPTQSEQTADAPYDPEAPWTGSNGLTYIPAPDDTAPKLPGEPGYVPPVD